MVGTYYGIAHYTMARCWAEGVFRWVLGGIGNLAGQCWAACWLGVVEALGAGYIGEIMDLCHIAGVSDALARAARKRDISCCSAAITRTSSRFWF